MKKVITLNNVNVARLVTSYSHTFFTTANHCFTAESLNGYSAFVDCAKQVNSELKTEKFNLINIKQCFLHF